MKPSEIERLIVAAGWRQVPGRGKGSHRVYFHPNNQGRIVIPWHSNAELRKGTELSILRQAGLR